MNPRTSISSSHTPGTNPFHSCCFIPCPSFLLGEEVGALGAALSRKTQRAASRQRHCPDGRHFPRGISPVPRSPVVSSTLARQSRGSLWVLYQSLLKKARAILGKVGFAVVFP